MTLYELLINLTLDYSKFKPVEVLGHSFKLYYWNDGLKLHILYEGNTNREALQGWFGVREGKLPSLTYWTEILLRNEQDFYQKINYQSIRPIVYSLQKDQLLGVLINIDTQFNKQLLRKAHILSKRNSRDAAIQKQLLESYSKDVIYSLRLVLLDNDPVRLFTTADKLTNLILSQSRKYEIKKLCVFGQCYPMKVVYNVPDWKRIFLAYEDYELDWGFAKLKKYDYKKQLWVTQEDIQNFVIVPDSRIVNIEFIRGTPLPEIVPERPNGFRIGETENKREVRLELEDFERHGYVIGGTGAGKTSALATIFTRFMKHYQESVGVIIDPNGDFAEQLATYYADYEKLIYVDPETAIISVNPLSVPQQIDRDQALVLAESNVDEIFTELFALKESAVYVKYVIENALKLLYMKTYSPTFTDLYNVILKLRTGEIDIPSTDPLWEAKLEQFQNLEDTTYISALSRLEEYATNPLLKKLFSKDSIDNILEPGNIVIINAANYKLGARNQFLLIAGWVYKLWYAALIRAKLRQKRIPVLTIIDEFEVISDLSIVEIILSQARKFGMHVILAHQHIGQLDSEMLRSIFNNTGLKILMNTGYEDDANKLAGFDPSFASDIKSTLPYLAPGNAVAILKPRGNEQTLPFKCKIDYTPLKADEEVLKKISERMKEKYGRKNEEITDVTAIVNPLLKYMERPPKPIEQAILFYVWKNKDHQVYQADLLRDLAVDRDYLKKVLAELQSDGMLDVEKEGNKVLVKYVRGLFRLKGVVSNEDGKKIALRVLVKYMNKGYVVVRGKQEGEIRPDFVAIKYEKNTFKPDYNNVIAVEIESPNEVEVHPEQVKKNMIKYMPIKELFKEIQIWTSEEKFDKLKEIYNSFMNDNSIPQEYKQKVKIFAVKLKQKLEQKATETKNKVEETGEFTRDQQTESKAASTQTNTNLVESKQQTVQGIANTNNNKQHQEGAPITTANEASANNTTTNAQGELKLGSLLKIGQLEFQVLDEVNGKVIVKTGDKDYKMNRKDLVDLEGLKDLIVEAKIENNYLKIKTSLGLTQRIYLEPV
ncbi:type IV secretory system conjugative DNA transfer family protein [Saccharolobus islandicus]|nr:type IV secretion system DNA-binding domain-containing protein [Sulfolobus islandicus]